MVITYYGEGCFRLQSGETSVLTDPQNNRLKADVVLETLSPASSEIQADKINFPGEYEIKGIEIQGFPVPEESTEKFLKTIYSVRFEDINFLFLGHISKMPDVKTLEQIDEPDVIFIPTGSEHFMSADLAAKLIKQLEPSIVIPSFCKNPSEFLKLLGRKGEQEDKVVFKKKDLGDAKRVVILNSQ